MTKMCSDCRWCGNGWFLFSQDHRQCKHPLVRRAECENNPAGGGRAFVGIERNYGFLCGREGKLWNTNRNGDK